MSRPTATAACRSPDGKTAGGGHLARPRTSQAPPGPLAPSRACESTTTSAAPLAHRAYNSSTTSGAASAPGHDDAARQAHNSTTTSGAKAGSGHDDAASQARNSTTTSGVEAGPGDDDAASQAFETGRVDRGADRKASKVMNAAVVLAASRGDRECPLTAAGGISDGPCQEAGETAGEHAARLAFWRSFQTSGMPGSAVAMSAAYRAMRFKGCRYAPSIEECVFRVAPELRQLIRQRDAARADHIKAIVARSIMNPAVVARSTTVPAVVARSIMDPNRKRPRQTDARHDAHRTSKRHHSSVPSRHPSQVWRPHSSFRMNSTNSLRHGGLDSFH